MIAIPPIVFGGGIAISAADAFGLTVAACLVTPACRNALLDAISKAIDQLRKQRAHMLVVAGRADEGIKEMKSIVAHYETTIAELHEEATFQFAEAALAAFQRGRVSGGKAFARSALQHAGMSQSISRTVLSAIELMQLQQEAASRKAHATIQQP